MISCQLFSSSLYCAEVIVLIVIWRSNLGLWMGFTSDVKFIEKLFWSIVCEIMFRIGFVSRMSGMVSWSESRNPICPSVPMFSCVLPCVFMSEFDVELGFGDPFGSSAALVVG